MAEPFDTAFDPFGGPALVSPQQTSPPDLQTPFAPPVLPQAPVHAPPVQLPQLIGNPAQTDPRQQLMAIAALGAMLGAGPRSGLGFGLGQGVVHEQDHLRQIAQARENQRFALQQQADAQLAAQQKTAATEQQQREQRLFGAIEKIKSDAKGATDPESYQETINGGSLALLQAGYRIPPTRLMQMVPYVPPEHEKKYVDAWEQWKKNPVNLTLLQQSPDKAILGTINVNMGTRAKPDIRPLPVGQVADLAGEGFAKDPTTGQLMVATKEATGTSAFDLKLKSLTDVFKATHRRDPNPQEKDALVTQAIEASKVKPPSPEKLIKVEHKDENGKAVIEWLPESEVRGKTFEKPTSAQVENRLASAKAVSQTGSDIIAQLSDPTVAKTLGPLLGRATTLRDFIGNPPPQFSELAGSIESYALANMGVHGMRSSAGAEQIKRLLDAHHTPESLIAAIRGLNKFSAHFMENEGMGTGQTGAPEKATPDLTGLGPGAKRKFSSGPFAGQSWSMVNGQPVQVP